MAELSAEALESSSGILHCRIDDRVKDLASNKEVPVANIITRHVKQVTDFNKALEKRRLWQKREKELEKKHEDTWGVLRSEGRAKEPREGPAISSSAKRVLDAIVVEGVDKEVVEKVKEKVARQFGSVDVHAATRQRAAREKEKQQLQRQENASDAWLPDRFYTEELKQKTPWLNPVEFLSGLQLAKREGSLTPVASDSESEASKRKKKKKKRKKEKKKLKKHKKKCRE
ncbi:hypothetical protein, conserved [Eimeria tenella]|uniref:Uncharacterized protein n=1 Tax=Eimeria tenella TaxID=5802 RepID=U6KTD8_EIMTE|nr:hypothetical protein, conserved [Eimeria tenella]CDJ39634.1 hypothetical protein, conserved [Eimeria tenella]|eukprot:XP_013230389.1 hypothetical protein, conserved [Eimeria tenella]